MDRIIKRVDFPKIMQPQFLKVCAYTRVSSGKDSMLHSLSAQVSHYSEMIQSHTGWVYCGVYSDEALTGTCLLYTSIKARRSTRFPTFCFPSAVPAPTSCSSPTLMVGQKPCSATARNSRISTPCAPQERCGSWSLCWRGRFWLQHSAPLSAAKC